MQPSAIDNAVNPFPKDGFRANRIAVAQQSNPIFSDLDDPMHHEMPFVGLSQHDISPFEIFRLHGTQADDASTPKKGEHTLPLYPNMHRFALPQ